MDSKRVVISQLYEKFKFEFFKNSLSWKEFIKIKDLGIICLRSYPSPNQDEYEIIDEKKWLINKIKYGF